MTRQGRAPRLAVFVSGHGFGHLVRTSAVLTALVALRSVRLIVVTAAPASIWPRELERHTERWVNSPCDAGVVQTDELHVDAAATREAVDRWHERASVVRDSILVTLADAGGIDGVLGDVPPMAFEIASTLGVPSIAVANFSWDWIYAEMGLTAAADAARRAYERTTLLLAATPAAPMNAFPRHSTIGVVGRRARGAAEVVRRNVGIAPGERCVLLAMRPELLARMKLPPRAAGVRYVGPTGWPCTRSDCVALPVGVDFSDALSLADAVVARAGYGVIGDCATNEIPLVWVRRVGFPEDSILADWLAHRDGAREVTVDALEGGGWSAALNDLWSRPRAKQSNEDGAALAAGEIAQLLD